MGSAPQESKAAVTHNSSSALLEESQSVFESAPQESKAAVTYSSTVSNMGEAQSVFESSPQASRAAVTHYSTAEPTIDAPSVFESAPQQTHSLFPGTPEAMEVKSDRHSILMAESNCVEIGRKT